MPAAIAHLIDHLRRQTPAARPDLSDAVLLRRFSSRHDEAAFADLVARHGSLVLRVCRHALDNSQDIEDAFQATFLTLARGAGTIRRPESLAAWLHGVARRVSLKTRRDGHRSGRRTARPLPLDPPDPRPGPLEELSARELLAAVDEEVERLPEVYRLPVLLCCLEGLSQEEVAARLAWTPGSVKGRLERGRRLLHQRLVRRGLTLTAALMAVEVSCGKAAIVPGSLAASTARTVCAPVTGISARVRILCEQGMTRMTSAKMLTGLGVLLVGLVTTGAVTLAARSEGGSPVQPSEPPKQAAQREHAPRTDAHSDPLPAEALARLGTVRFRHANNITSLAFTPDGKQVVSHGEDGIRVWDAATGREVASALPEAEGWIWGAQLTRDGRMVVSQEGRTNRFVVCTRDRGTLKLRREFVLERASLFFRFSPDGKYLALVTEPGSLIELWDVEAGKQIRSWQASKARLWVCRFSADGKTLITASEDKVLRFWDIPSGKQVREISGYPDIVGLAVPSPDGSLLATVAMTEVRPGAGSWPRSPSIRLWDLVANKEVRRLEVKEKQTDPSQQAGVFDAAFSPDGKTLATSGPARTVRFWDVATGKERRRLDLSVSVIAFSPDGKTLAVAEGSQGRAVRLIDVTSGKSLHPQGAHQDGVEFTSFTPDGRTVVTGRGFGPVRVWDAKSGRERGRLGADAPARALRILGDGRTLVVMGTDRGVQRWDLTTFREQRRFPDAPLPTSVFDLTPDGKSALAIVRGKDEATAFRALSLVDVASGKERHRLAGHSQRICRTTFSPDGRTLVVCCIDRTAHVWDVASGRKLRQISLVRPEEAPDRGDLNFEPHAIALSPDGRLLAYGSSDWQYPFLSLYETDTGTLSRRLDLSERVGAVTFSPDGRMLAWGGWTDPRIHLVEVVTGRERHVFRGHKGRILSLTISADARRLVSGSADTTALVWDLSGRLGESGKEAKPPTPAELEAAWAGLAGEDAARAYQALRLLASASAEVVPYLRKHLRPIAVVDAGRLGRLVADLDSPRFVLRQKAAHELEALGSAAEPALRRALAGQPSAEARNRIEKLLEQEARQRSSPSRDRLRQMRSLEALELAGDGEARGLLKELAGGMPGTWLTEQARTALGRLARPLSAAP
jgi:RNA polymerase sigma factor (sigma-70 family)